MPPLRVRFQRVDDGGRKWEDKPWQMGMAALNLRQRLASSPARPLLPTHTHTLTLATATRTHNTDIKAKRNQAPAARKAARDAAVRAVKEAKKSKKGGKKK